MAQGGNGSLSKTPRDRQDKDSERVFFDEVARTRGKYTRELQETRNTVLNTLCFPPDLWGWNVLEAGCATGDYGVLLAERGATVYGVDISPEMIRRNREYNEDAPRYRCAVGDLEDQEIASPETYNAVLCFEFLHHFPNPEQVIRNFYQWLKPGGKVYIFEPNGANVTNRIFKAVRRLIGVISPDLVTRYHLSSPNEVRNHFPQTYRSIAEKSGFTVVYSRGYSLWNTRPKNFDILNVFGYVRWALSKMFRTQDHIGMIFKKP